MFHAAPVSIGPVSEREPFSASRRVGSVVQASKQRRGTCAWASEVAKKTRSTDTLCLRSPPLRLQANGPGVEEEKMGVGVGEGLGVGPSRRGGGSAKATGRFQRRLEEASAEVAAESAAAPRIAVAAAAGEEAKTGEARLSGGGGATACGLAGESTKTMKKKTWGDDDDHHQLDTVAVAAPVGGGRQERWTPREDRRLERLVRECVFDFDLVAARFSSSSSAGDVNRGDGGEGER